jgi:hypothetical protein
MTDVSCQLASQLGAVVDVVGMRVRIDVFTEKLNS